MTATAIKIALAVAMIIALFIGWKVPSPGEEGED